MMTEEEKRASKLLHTLQRRLRKTIDAYGLVKEGDRILVGLSGGKDSLALVELLGERQKVFKPRFSVVAAHVSVANIGYRSDLDYLKSHCEKHGVPFEHRVTSFDESTDKRKTHCFLCSWHRRKALFGLAKELGCNKIALGHHQDDIIQTLVMNLLFQGSFGTMPPLLKMEKFDMQIIRPLALIRESELVELEKLRGYRKQEKNCPYEKETNRNDVKKLLTEMERIAPGMRSSVWNAMTNIQADYLPREVDAND